MKRKRKPRARLPTGHNTPLLRGSVHPIEVVLDYLCGGRDSEGHGRREGIRELVDRLVGGRVSWRAVRYWATGSRRAPAWFIAVLRAELDRRILAAQGGRARLLEYKASDIAERSHNRAVAARRLIAEGRGAIGQREARKRREALERDQRERAAWDALNENNAPMGSPVAAAPEKTTQ